MCADDAYGQARRIFEIIAASLGELGADLNDVIRSRIYLADMSDFAAVAEVHAQYLGAAAPAATCVQVSAFVDARMRVEIEVDAVVAR